MFRCHLLVSGMVVQLAFLHVQHVRIQVVWLNSRCISSSSNEPNVPPQCSTCLDITKTMMEICNIRKNKQKFFVHKHLYIYIQYMFFKHISYIEKLKDHEFIEHNLFSLHIHVPLHVQSPAKRLKSKPKEHHEIHKVPWVPWVTKRCAL